MKSIIARFLFVPLFASCFTNLVVSSAFAQKDEPSSMPAQVTVPNDKEVIDAYHYFLGRMLILRQEILDFKAGFKWNQMVPRKVGEVAWANPNLDVAYGEAWLGINNKTCALVTIPRIQNRYYTFQVLNSWGETVSNINERNFPQKPFGKFAYCTKDSTVKTAPDVERISLDGHKFRVLSRVELSTTPKDAERLQKQIKVSTVGAPIAIEKPVQIAMFTNKDLPGVEIFDHAEQILMSEPDINPGMEPLQQSVMRITQALRNKEFKNKADRLIREEAIPEFNKAFASNGDIKNSWFRPKTIGNYGSDYLSRTMINYGGIWANNTNEAVYFKTNLDGEGRPLNGSSVYTMHFAKGDNPASHAKYFWSIVAVDGEKFNVIPNPKKKYIINNNTKISKNKDGSFTLVFASKQPKGVALGNWMPTPDDKNYHLTFRFYGPDDAVRTGDAFPPPLVLKTANEKLSLLENDYVEEEVIR
ncbi:DUF1214 domain-containing protein [Bdellovibrio sp. NC01]|uniref:DUF1214 domain-containing protein n=1 Tax=Bdellovibrio sp. NC01 TaxID=2220073 RepID=UPI00115B5390|nr:DUF1214 domain-containing protein [Bdellovibrio sp. NC01]QDK37056.1 DUF1254 domain-containing protein [Bdellovibrio sp. NC01]